MPRHELAHAIAEERIRQALDTGASRLSLARLRIDSLPERFLQLAPQLVELDLSDCQYLSALPPLAGFGALRQLKMRGCWRLGGLGDMACAPHLEALDLSGCPMLSDFSALPRLRTLRTLDLARCNSMGTLPPLSGLLHLQELDLSWCHALRDISALAGLPQLQALDLSGCMANDLSALAQVPALRSLRLSDGPADVDLALFTSAAQLQHLDLGACLNLRNLDALGALTQLTSLLLPDGNLSDLTPIAELSQLVRLDISGQEALRDLSPISRLQQLQSLSLPAQACALGLSAIERLPQLRNLQLHAREKALSLKAVAGLSQLQSLGLYGLSGQTELSALSDLHLLESLTMTSCTALEDLSALAGMEHLRTLCIMGAHRLERLAPLANLKQLEQLELMDCTALHELAPIGALPQLEYLDLSGGTAIRDLSALAGLKHLKRLDLRNCRGIQDVTPIGELTQLNSLTLSGNQDLADLRPLANLEQLRTLNLFACKALKDLSPLTLLKQLASLDLSGCPMLQDLSPLLALAKLRILRVHRSPTPGLTALSCWASWPQLTTLTASTLACLPADLRSRMHHDNLLDRMTGWMNDLAEHGSIPADEVKLFVLGNGRIGKTQISRRLCGLPFDESVPSTHGVILQRFELPGRVQQAPQTVQLWDFGGQDLFLGTHSLFLDERAMYLLLWHHEQEGAHEVWDGGLCLPSHRLSYWLEYVRSMAGPEAPLIVAQAQCDGESSLLEAPIPAEHGFRWLRRSSCSAKSDDGLERLMLDLRSGAKLLAERYGEELIPKNWAELGKVVRQHAQTQKVMPLADYRQLCNTHGVRAPTTLLTYLHQSGQVFWREGVFDSALILDQAWALEGVYALLHRDKVLPALRRQGGRFTAELLESLLWEGRFSAKEQAHFLSLMVSCRVCFELAEGEYLAPDCLQERAAMKSAEDSVWRDAQPDAELHLVYPFLHAGLQRTLLAEMGSMAGRNAVYWRHGCCLFDAHAKTLLRMDCQLDATRQGPGRVVLEASGANPGTYLEQVVAHLLQGVQIGRPPEKHWIRGEPSRTASATDEPRALESMDADPARPPVVVPAPLPSGATSTRDKPVVYVSYAWGGDSDATVDGLQKALTPWVEVHRDKEVMRTGDSIRRFEEEIGRGLCVLVVLSARYMQSVDCMRELGFIWERAQRDPEQFARRVIPVVLEDAGIGRLTERLRHVQHWKANLAELKALVADIGPVECGQSTTQQLQDIGTFTVHLADALNSLADKVMPQGKAKLEASNYLPVVDLVKRRLQLG